jgi:hypothetical protein
MLKLVLRFVPEVLPYMCTDRSDRGARVSDVAVARKSADNSFK